MIDEVFGCSASRMVDVLTEVVPHLNGRVIDWPEAAFENILRNDVVEGRCQYCVELLGRVYLAASASIVRQYSWLEGTVDAYRKSNYLAFSACLRGLIEATADSVYSLEAVPFTIAENANYIYAALMRDRSQRGVCMCKELEDRLIHFQYAKQGKKGNGLPENHVALQPWQYQKYLERYNSSIRQLYCELCERTHPSLPSISWTYRHEPGIPHVFVITGTSGAANAILQLIDGRTEQLMELLMAGFNFSLLCLKTLRCFGSALPQLSLEVMDSVDLSDLPGWEKIQYQFSKEVGPEPDGSPE
jgi:hypothetical protein